MGYATALESFARFHLEKGSEKLSFRGIRSSAETLWPYQRELLQKAFDSPVLNFYGSREVNNIAAQCPEEGGLHLISTFKYLEIVDKNGKRLPHGVEGNIALTDMSNHAMPFIRYLNDDVGTLDAAPCRCGRPSPVLKELLGRSTDLIRTPDGEVIHGEFFTHLFYGQEEIKAFQIHQTAKDRLVVRLVPTGDIPVRFLEELIEKITARVGDGVKVEVEFRTAIKALPSGKFRFTISDVKPEEFGGATG
jgi:phenylacetate-CoA ligase